MANQRRTTSLPQDIIFNILTRLPTKSVAQCKVVRRDWRAMISSREFVKEHLAHAKDMKSYDFHKFMYITRRFCRFGTTISSAKSIDFSTFNQVPLNLPFGERCLTAQVFASCDGLLLVFKGDRTYILWNPSTGVYKEFSGLHTNKYIPFQTRLYGIVYDASIDAYKVIAISRINNSREDTIITVYNCRTNLCTYTTGFQYWVPRNEQGIVVNEVPHWLVSHQENLGCAIIYYDLGEETFKEVPKPDWAEDVSKLELTAHKELLCLVHYTMGYADIWVMENYGERVSWIKLYPHVSYAGALTMRPLGLTQGNHVVMEVDQSRIATYDPTTRIFSFKIPHTTLNTGFYASTYVESLVSPSAGNE